MKKSKYFIKGLILFFLLIILTISSIKSQTTYYSYMSGAWNNLDTWTTDPGGTTLVGSQIPTDGDAVVILMSRTVTLTNDTATTTLDITINSGGILDIGSYSFTSGLTALRGEGTLMLTGTNFPSATTNTFVETGGGTTEYNNSSNFTLPAAQTEYNNLTLNLSATTIIATQLNNITLNGDLYIKTGIYQINDASANRRQLTIDGDVTVDNGSSITVGAGNTRTHATVTGISGGTEPFVDYYDANTHRVVINGDFTNSGTVQFTNQSYPVFDAFPTDGAATVYFMGNTDNTLTCNNTTDFYNLVVDKGSDQTYQLSVNSSDYYYFRLFGANISGGENGGENPILKKALWIRNGTFRLFGKVVIPSLSEGACDPGLSGGPNSDFYIPANGAFVIDGPDVIVLTTADDYREINAAYNVSGGTGSVNGLSVGGCSSFSVYGKFQIDDGYISTRESGGFIYWGNSSGEFIINGGTLDGKQLRTANSSGGLTAYRQTGGTLTLRGRLTQTVSGVSTVADLATVPLNTTQTTNGINGNLGTFNIDRDDNIFEMTGGTIEILDVCGEDASSISRAYEVNSLPAYYSVSGGSVQIIPTDGTDTDYNYYVASSAPIYNLTIDDAASSGFDVLLTDIPAKSGVTARTNPPLTVSNDLTFTNNATLNANNYEVQVGGDFSLPSGSTYTPGTNKTTFNGSAYQTFTGGGTITSGFYKLEIDKSADTLIFTGAPTSYTIQDSLIINEGTVDDGGKSLNIAGHIYNAGTHTGTGKILLNGAGTQTLEASVFGSPTLGNVELNNSNDASLLSDFTVNSFTFNTGILDISQYRLTIGTSGVSGYSSTLYFYTNGLISDGGLRMYVDASTLTTGNDLVYPFGTTDGYTPVTIVGNTAPGSGIGYVTFIPVNSEHPARRTAGKYLLYYWKSIAESMPATSNVYYTFYNNIGTDWEPGINTAFTLLEGGTDWNAGGSANEPNISINGVPNSAGFISAEISAGNPGAFNNIDAYYSIASGAFNSTDAWSTTSHTGADCNCSPSNNTDIIYIGGDAATNRNDSITVTAGFTAALITINGSYTNDEVRPVLNIQNLGGSITVNNIKGNGKFTTTSATLTSANMGDFLNGDSAVFNYDGGNISIPASISSYPTLLITSNAVDIVKTLPNIDVLVNQDLKIASSSTGNTLRYNSGGGSLTIYGDVALDNASNLEFDGATAQNLTVYGNLNLDYDDSGADANTLGVNTGTAAHQINFYGDSIIVGASSISLTNGSLSILDSLNTVVTDGTGSITLNKLTINKNNLTDTVTISEDFTLSGTTNSSPKALTLSNGTLILENASTDVELSSGGADFEISQTTALILKNGASVNVIGDGTGIFLDGLLSAEGTSAIDLGDGSNTNNRYIEYSGSGNAEIILSGSASLTVNSQIRRSLSQTNGVLKFSQSGSASTTIYGRGGSATRAKFEVLNSGSEFYMTGGNLTIIRGGGNTYGDLYLRPASGSATGGTITLGSVDVGVQTIKFDSEIALNTLMLNGVGTDNTFQLMVNPLVMNGDLTINSANSIFDANSINVTLKGDLTNNGTYTPGTNTTTFDGTTQSLLGSTVTDFYNLVSAPSTSLTFNYDITIGNDLSINSGTLSSSTYDIFVGGDIVNNGTHSGDAAQGGLILNGSAEQDISGAGTFGRLNLYNTNGARILNNLSLNQDILLSTGVLNINQYLLTLGENSDIIDTVGDGFSSSKMIEPDGVFSNVGIQKNFPSGAQTFIFPLGVSGKYTPADLDITASSTAGSIRINCINDNHPTVTDDTEVLQYYWEIESSGITGFEGELKLKYDNGDVAGTESDYIAARLVIPDGTSWSKATPGSDATDNVYEATDTIIFTFPAGTDNLSGEYTAGGDAAIPATVPTYTSNSDGDWNDVNIWTPVAPSGGPNGFIVVISPGDSVNTNGNRRFAYKTTINGILDVEDSYGHNLGTVEGTGKLRLEGPLLPAGRFNGFLSCSGGILEYNGSTDYTIVADRLDTLRCLYFTGTGVRTLPAKDLVICDTLKISGATLDNSVNNKKLTINGVFQRLNSGVFTSGTGAGATVVFAGSAAQTLGGADGEFTGSNKFNNFEINNSSGLTLNSPLEINRDLALTDGVITTTSTNILKMLVEAGTITPEGGSSDSYINGPMSKDIMGGDNLYFPLGDGTRYGKLQLIAVQDGIWQAEYFNSAYSDLTTSPGTFNVSSTEYWKITSPSDGLTATVELRWDPNSDITPLTVTGGSSNIRVAEYSGAAWIEKSSTVTDSDNYDGTIKTSVAVPINTASHPQYYTLGSVSAILAKAYFTTADDVCNGTSIPVSFSGVTSGELNFTLSYKIGVAAQPDETVSSLPYSLPTSGAGSYQLTGFTYNNPPHAGPPVAGVVDPSTVTVNPLPTAFNVTGGGSYCIGSGGVVVGLANSESNVNYELFAGVTSVGIWAGSTGNPINFGNQTNTGTVTYSVVATDASGTCSNNMATTVNVTENPLPMANDQTPADLCSDVPGENAQATVDLTSLHGSINTDASGDQFDWYEDAALTTPVGTPASASISKTFSGGTSVTEDFYCVVTLVATGCSDTATVTYTILRVPETGPEYTIPNDHAN